MLVGEWLFLLLLRIFFHRSISSSDGTFSPLSVVSTFKSTPAQFPWRPTFYLERQSWDSQSPTMVIMPALLSSLHPSSTLCAPLHTLTSSQNKQECTQIYLLLEFHSKARILKQSNILWCLMLSLLDFSSPLTIASNCNLKPISSVFPFFTWLCPSSDLFHTFLSLISVIFFVGIVDEEVLPIKEEPKDHESGCYGR